MVNRHLDKIISFISNMGMFPMIVDSDLATVCLPTPGVPVITTFKIPPPHFIHSIVVLIAIINKRQLSNLPKLKQFKNNH
ncbi:protein of unknown function [Candidatus Nitrosocosmicus franklandus]|uniref:Uncharacterized protein n=1 Tax=Candidatus Nitrosocosmicus franklandianus TaxID=1798806 RepID=A0A484IA59_9ARCH|nr:protein of unknown function [Candidatus Nitrosocosmicus franklandus]